MNDSLKDLANLDKVMQQKNLLKYKEMSEIFTELFVKLDKINDELVKMNINDTGFILQIFDTHEEAKLAAKKFVLSDRYKSLCIELGKDQLDWTIQRAEYYVKRIE